jgi:hypothetical protein
MEKLPTELIYNILDIGDYEEIDKLCLTNKKNESICENYFTNKIKSKFKTSSKIYAGLMLRVDIVVEVQKGEVLHLTKIYILKNHIVKKDLEKY